jgi:hypothetical protein
MNGWIFGLVLMCSGMAAALQAARDARGVSYRFGDTSLVDLLGPDGARMADLALATLMCVIGVVLAAGLGR